MTDARPRLLDGAMGTVLEHQGVPTPAPQWTAAALAAHPDAVRAVHAAYAAAGATVHTAATFRTQPGVVGPQAARTLTRRAVALAREAVPAHHQVAGSLAPLEDCWHPELSPPDPAPAHRAFAALLRDAGVDRILVETFAHVGEAVVATRAAVATGLEVWTSLTPGYDGTLMDPTTFAEGVDRVRDAGADAVLVNCLPARRAAPWVEVLAAAGGRWGVYANAGDPAAGLALGTPGAAESYAALARGWVDAGAAIVGGCCGTGPAHIAAIAAALDPRRADGRTT